MTQTAPVSIHADRAAGTLGIVWDDGHETTYDTTTLRWLKIVFWVNTCITAVATLYFGWHYVADDIAGVAIALFSFYVGGWASGQSFTRYRAVERQLEEVTTV